MVETTQAATSSTDYQALAVTFVKLWALYRPVVIGAFVVLLLATLVVVIRKSSWGKWILLLTIFTGGSILMLDELDHYVAQQKKAALKKILLSPITKPIKGVGSFIKGIFRVGK